MLCVNFCRRRNMPKGVIIAAVRSNSGFARDVRPLGVRRFDDLPNNITVRPGGHCPIRHKGQAVRLCGMPVKGFAQECFHLYTSVQILLICKEALERRASLMNGLGCNVFVCEDMGTRP